MYKFIVLKVDSVHRGGVTASGPLTSYDLELDDLGFLQLDLKLVEPDAEQRPLDGTFSLVSGGYQRKPMPRVGQNIVVELNKEGEVERWAIVPKGVKIGMNIVRWA